MRRLFPLVPALTLALAATATAQDSPAPLKGEGENFEIVGTHNIPEGQGTDIEVAGDFAYVAFRGGLAIVDISDPRAPKRVGTVECGGGHDIALSPDATIAYLASDGNLGDCGDGSGTAIIDVRDKSRPQLLSAILTPVGSHTVTVDGYVLSSNNYADNNVYLYDITDPRNPKLMANVQTPGASAFHDSFFDHRPDGKVLLYGASGEGQDVYDVTDPANPVHRQRISDPEVSFAHQLEPNFDRSILIGSDEWMGGGRAGACGQVPGSAPITPLPGPGAATDLGAYHFYRAAEDGNFAGPSPAGDKLGTFNLPFEAPQSGGCTSHVFWTAPDSDRLVGAWYVHGTRVVDFSDPAAPKQIGWFEPEGADTWASKPHRGYIFTGDLERGMDVLRYTGQGWPADAPAADVQRKLWNGFPAPSPAPSTGSAPPPRTEPGRKRRYGRFSIAARVKVPSGKARKARLTVSFVDAGAAVVAIARRQVKSRRALKLRLTGKAEAGRYRFIVRSGGKKLKQGRFTVGPRAGTSLPTGVVMRARVR